MHTVNTINYSNLVETIKGLNLCLTFYISICEVVNAQLLINNEIHFSRGKSLSSKIKSFFFIKIPQLHQSSSFPTISTDTLSKIYLLESFSKVVMILECRQKLAKLTLTKNVR